MRQTHTAHEPAAFYFQLMDGLGVGRTRIAAHASYDKFGAENRQPQIFATHAAQFRNDNYSVRHFIDVDLRLSGGILRSERFQPANHLVHKLVHINEKFIDGAHCASPHLRSSRINIVNVPTIL